MASFYPFYAIALNALDGIPEASLTILTQPRDDCPRAYELSEWDAAMTGSADALILGGRGFEGFEELLIRASGSRYVLVLMEDMALIRDGIPGGGEGESHFAGENPWAFLSTRGAEGIAEALAVRLAILDPANAERYAENKAAFQRELMRLRAEIEAILAPVRGEPVALMHEGLEYFAEEWGLNAVATIRREPGTHFEDAELAEAVGALRAAGARAVLIERQAPMRLRHDLERAGFAVVRIDTLTTGAMDGNRGAYAEAMLRNAEELARALK